MPIFRLQDNKLRQIVTLGPQDTLEEKTVTVCHGSDFVNMTFVNFCCTRRDIAQVSPPILRTWPASNCSLGASGHSHLRRALVTT